ncbi:MAG TPA: 50S ribosomal protein L3 [Candidatus Saccharimonadales bacterium]|nr:50S ribosomal protein L3 [Candidatus Saccharimonadales bacterium]
MKALITRKLGMTSILDEKGAAIAVTLLSASPNVITQLKTDETDGYGAVQLGFESSKRPAKPQAGHFKPSKTTPKLTREFRITGEDDTQLTVGDHLAADSFEVGDIVKVIGISKGKGFAGTIKRHNFKLGRKTHGGRSYRRPGSIGSMYPQRIFPGKKMAGQMGHEQVTTKNLRVAIIDADLHVIGVDGAVPGPRKGLVLIKGAK